MRAPFSSELEAIAAFAARCQAVPGSRIAYAGETPSEIAAELREWKPAWPAQSLVTDGEEGIAGYVGVELDLELGRAWIWGPFVEANAWALLAENLLTEALARLVPPGVDDLELSGDEANTRLATLAARHGFVAGVTNHALEIDSDTVNGLPRADVPAVATRHHAELVALHDSLFPQAYYSGAQLIEQSARGDATVLGLVEEDRLVGYVAGRVDASGEGYLDFVGVAEHARGGGRGRQLVVAMCHALLERPGPTKVSETVRSDSEAALALYERLGFRRVASLVGYRRRLESPASGIVSSGR